MHAPSLAVILAAGKGTRMKSRRPKVLHELAGRPMLDYVVRATLAAGVSRVVVVVGHGRELVERHLASYGDRVVTVVQEEQRGTGHAVSVALPALRSLATSSESAADARVLVLAGDSPLLQEGDLRLLLEQPHDIGLLTAVLPDATGYGRILRDARGQVVGIREERDCSAAERAIGEFNTGVYVFPLAFLERVLPTLGSDNAQGEMYLTDLVAQAAAVSDGGLATREVFVRTVPAERVEGINDRVQLAELEGRLLQAIVRRHQLAGVTIRNPASVSIEDTVTIGPDTVLEGPVVLRGSTRIGSGVHVDVGCVLTNVVVDDEVVLKPYTVASDARIGARSQIGPFSHLRPASELSEDCHVGNFVELKKTRLGRGSKANHLAYLGDGEVGSQVNIGAGTIFCNYDGFKKHVTRIEDGAFIGSDSQLVAPVTVGKDAYVATGTTVTRDVPSGALAVGRARQENKEGYAERMKARLKAR